MRNIVLTILFSIMIGGVACADEPIGLVYVGELAGNQASGQELVLDIKRDLNGKFSSSTIDLIPLTIKFQGIDCEADISVLPLSGPDQQSLTGRIEKRPRGAGCKPGYDYGYLIGNYTKDGDKIIIKPYFVVTLENNVFYDKFRLKMNK